MRAVRAILAVGLLLPAVVFILLDRAPFSGDDAVYGRATLTLFRTAVTSPMQWFSQAMSVLDFKANGLIWIGQFFVPAGQLIGSIDKGLLLSVWLTQLLAIAVLMRAVLVFSNGQLPIAVLAAAGVASAPMFVLLGGQYRVESSQVLAVSWFVLILARARHWNPAYTLAHLVGASAFACLTKTTTPVFCVWPGLLTLVLVACPSPGRAPWSWGEARVIRMGAASVVLTVLTAAWYIRNWDRIVVYTKTAAFGPFAALWGIEDTFVNTLSFWLAELPRCFFIVPAAGFAVFGLVAIVAITTRRKIAEFDWAFLIALLQTITILCVFAFSANRETRYLLPVVPYLGLAAAWAVHRLQSRLATRLALVGFGVQFLLVYGLAFGWFSSASSYPVRRIDTTGTDRALLDAIVARTCSDRENDRYVNVIAIDATFRGDWLMTEPADYVSERDFGRAGTPPPCRYGYLGGNFLGSSAPEAWEALLADRVNYVVTIDPNQHAVSPKAYNEALKPEAFRMLWSNLTTTGLFSREAGVSEDPAIAVFRNLDRVDHLAVGRAYSDQGKHDLAIMHLVRATTRTPNSIEAWANLQQAYEQQGDLKGAIAAGEKALVLSPNHY
jgi:hypothetical protein